MNKILIAAVGIIVIIGGVFLLSSNANKNSTSTQTIVPTQTETQATTSPTIQEDTASGAAVTLASNGFNPTTLTVKVGTKVAWTNKSGENATVNSTPHPTHTAYPPLNLGSFADGASVSLVFDKTGSYGYHNHLNASQTGTVIVE